MLDRVVDQPEWAYLAPLQKLRPLYWEIKKPQYRLRKHGEIRKAATKYIGRNRLGPLHLDTRRWMLGEVLAIQDEVNQAAREQGNPEVLLINANETGCVFGLELD
jgi:DNA sulfur modification protein DndC